MQLWICEHLNISCSEPLSLQQEGGTHGRCSVNNTGCCLNQHCLQLKPESPPQSKDSLENQEIRLPQLLDQTQDPKTQRGEAPVQAAVNLLPEPAQAPFLK